MKRHVHLDLEPCPICAADRKETPMRQSTMVGISCLLLAVACVAGSFYWAGPLYGALLVLAIGGLTTTFAVMVDLREREERDAERWPPREGLSR